MQDLPLRIGSRQTQRATAQALHGKGKIGQGRMKGEHLTDQDQAATIEYRENTAVRGRYAVSQPARRAKRLHPVAAGLINMGFIDLLCGRPVRQLGDQPTVRILKKG